MSDGPAWTSQRPEEVLLRMFDMAAPWPHLRQAIRETLRPEEAAANQKAPTFRSTPSDSGAPQLDATALSSQKPDQPITLREAAIRVVDKRTLTFEGDMFLVSRREMRYLEKALGDSR